MTAVWIPADQWLADQEHRRARRTILGYQAPPIRRALPEPSTLPAQPGRARYPKPPASEVANPWPELRTRIDQVVKDIRRQHKRRLAGRRQALLEDRELAREVYQLVQERGVNDALISLDVSRQALHDIWKRHGWPAPIGSGNCTGRTP